MRIIVLTDEEKKRIEERVTTKAVNQTRKRILRGPNRICPVCKKQFNKDLARKNHHKGRCSIACNPGGVPVHRKSRAERRALKQLRKLKKRQESQKINRVRRQSAEDFYDTREWRELRFKVLRRLGFRCLACGARPGPHPLHVDHIKPRSKYPELELCEDNLQVLCRDCNLGKSNHFEDDLRNLD